MVLSNHRQRIKLCAIFAERDLQLADQLEAVGDVVAADVYRDMAALWAGLALCEARQAAALSL